MKEISEKNEKIKTLTFVQNPHPIPIYIFIVIITVILDIMSPLGPVLIIAAVLVGVLYAYYKYKWRNISFKKESLAEPLKRTTLFLLSASFIIFSASAMANFSSRHVGGLLAQWIPEIKTWQDAYLVSIKEDTERILYETENNSRKIDETNAMLKQMLASFKPELEKPLVEQIPKYAELAENEQNALLLFTSKVGVNGLPRYEKLINTVNTYAENKTPENARAVADNFDYIVRVNGVDIEDTKTKKTLMSLFLDPETYAYIMGSGVLPSNTDLLTELNINITGGIDEMLDDPLAIFIKQLEMAGEKIKQEVVIPTNQIINYKPEPIIQDVPVIKKKVIPKRIPAKKQQSLPLTL